MRGVRPPAPGRRAAIRRVLAAIRRGHRFLCSGHVRSDGDALGSQLALDRVIRRLGRRSHVVCDGGALPEYEFLPGASDVGSGPHDLRPPYDTVLTCDSGSWTRLARIAEALPRRDLTVINIDHHASNERFGDVNWIDPSYSSTGEMIWDLAKAADVPLDEPLATCCYVASVTDTGRFSFSNTTPDTHRNAAEMLEAGVRPAVMTKRLWRQKSPGHLRMLAEVLQALRTECGGRLAWLALTPAMSRRARFVPGETQEYMDLMMSLKTVEVAVLFRPQADRREVKVSWRTSPGIDGIALARQWGGGGHPRASGATVSGTLDQARRAVLARTRRQIERGRRLTEKEEAEIARM